MLRYGYENPAWGTDPAAKEQAGREEAVGKAVSRLLRLRYAANPWTKKSAPFAE
jgi:hypothetical protein